MMLRTFRSDLHIHTCLSPCGELEMSPQAIVRTCLEKELDLIAVCDHNSAENVEGVRKAAESTDLTILPGMEVTTVEEVHILAIFDEQEQVMKLQEDVYGQLLPGENDDDLFGIQVVANELDEVEKIVHKLLIGGTTLSLDNLVERIHGLGGLVICSHIDRESYSIVGQLGMIPEHLPIDALEVSPRSDVRDMRSQCPGAEHFPLITSSDAHRLDEIGKSCTVFSLEEPNVCEIRKAFKNVDGRKIIDGGLPLC